MDSMGSRRINHAVSPLTTQFAVSKKCVRDQSGILVDSGEAEDEKKKNVKKWVSFKLQLKRSVMIDGAAKLERVLALPDEAMWQVTAKTAQDIQHYIAALYAYAGIDKGFVETFLGLSCGMKTFQLLNYAVTAFDVIDGGLDFAAVYELAQYHETAPHAVWLAVTTVITLVVELWIKAGVWTLQSAGTKAGLGGVQLDLNTDTGKMRFIMNCAVLEVAIFYVEDATTLFIFWHTGLAGSSAATTANLYFSMASGVMAMFGFAYGLSQLLKDTRAAKDTLKKDARLASPLGEKCLYYLIATIMAANLVFWCWFGLGIINKGEFYNCIGGCAAKATAVAENPALFAALAEALDQTVKSLSIADAELISVAAATIIGGLSPDCDTTAFGNVDGSGEAIVVNGGSSNSSLAENATFEFGSHTPKDERVNKAVLAMYVIGWFAAVYWVWLVNSNLSFAELTHYHAPDRKATLPKRTAIRKMATAYAP